MALVSGISHQGLIQLTMANNTSRPSPCFYLLASTSHEISDRYLVNLITAIINIVSAPFAVVSNILIAVAIFNIARLRTPSNLLIGCLALSDILVGLLVQPCYITFRLTENRHRKVPCFVRIVYANAFYVCCGVSFMTLSAVSYERFVAVRLWARYNDIFSSQRILKYTVAIWVVNVVLTSLQWAGITKISTGMHLILWLLCFLVSVVANTRIILVLRRHRLQMQSHQVIAHNENIRRRREASRTRTILIIVAVYLLLNAPVLFAKICHEVFQLEITTYNHYSWTETLAFLNSCTNPIICLWRNHQIREGIKLTLNRLFCM